MRKTCKGRRTLACGTLRYRMDVRYFVILPQIGCVQKFGQVLILDAMTYVTAISQSAASSVRRPVRQAALLRTILGGNYLMAGFH